MSKKTLRILVIEDEVPQYLLLTRMLQRDPDNEYEFTHTVSLAEGLELVQALPFDAVFLDLGLPPESYGWESFVAMQPYTEDAAIIVLTGGDAEIGVEAVRGGAQDYLRKSALTQDLLRRTVAHAVERHRLRRQLQSARVVAKQAERDSAELVYLKSKLTDDLSHELRTPLTAIQLYLALAARADNDRRLEYIGVMQEQVDTLIAIVEDAFAISRIDSLKKLELVFEDVNLNLLVQRVVGMFAMLAQSKSLAIELQLSQDPLIVSAIPSQLMLALNKVMENAVQYTEHGSIMIATFEEGPLPCAAVKIVDSGSGINKDDLPFVFDRLYRGRDISQLGQRGSGMGLAIANEAMTLHQGAIIISSEPEGGTTVKLTLPQVRAKSAES